MRLTLRTLLAYRDHVLKAGELEDMHARVQQSAMAANLLKRIDALVNRPTILAPPVEGKGLGADANSIAEYLDDALKRDKVPELERICLESDVQLAELAQCHHLLSTALSTPVEVPPGLRERVVSFGEPAARAKALAERPTGLAAERAAAAAPRVAAAPAASEAGQPASGRTGAAATQQAAAAGDGRAARLVKAQLVEAPMVASGGESIRPTGLDLEGSHLAHEVPEYLRGRTHDRWRGPLAIGGLVAVLMLLVWQALGSWETMRELFASRPVATTGTASAEPKPGGGGDSGAAAALASDAQPRPDGRTDSATVATGESSDSVGATGARSVGDLSAPPLATEQTAGSSKPSTAAAATSSQSAAQSTLPHAAEWLPSDSQSMRAVILAYAGQALPLHRMQAAERLPSGTQVVVPPASRPTLDLAKGPQWTFCGPTQMSVSLPETGEQATPRVDLRLGRALISAGTQGQAVEIQTPDARLLLSMSDPATRVAVDLSYVPVQHGPVTDRASNPPVLHVYAVDGSASVSVRGASGQASPPIALEAGQMILVSGGAASEVAASETPAWTEPTSDRPVDVLAAEDLQRQLAGNQPVGQTLQALVSNRRPETRSLAAQTLVLLGGWDWVVVEKNPLSDSRDRSYWPPLLDLTRQVIAAHPDDGKTLRQVLTGHDPQRGEFQAAMWLGLTEAQLQNDGLKAMVDRLESDVLLDRILAIYQLQRLTGKDFGYQAGEVNQASVQQWKRELASNQLQIIRPGEVAK